MISFDFMRSAPPEALRKVLEFRMPERYHAVLVTLGAIALTLAGGWSIESHRLRQTLALQEVYRQRYDASVRALRGAKVFEERVKRLVALDARLRSIRLSGFSDAARLAELANNLPEHAWLTSISNNGDAISLEGRAKDLRVLSEVVRGLTRTHNFRNPSLVSAIVATEPPDKGLVKYVLRVESVPR